MVDKEPRDDTNPRSQFVEEFQQDLDRASHLVSVKRYYHLIRKFAPGSVFVAYFAIMGVTVSGVGNSSGAIKWASFLILGVLGLGMLFLLILRLDIGRHDITDNELALHELSQAVSVFENESLDYEKWSRHLSNTSMLIEDHGARPFSRKKERQFRNYVNWVEEIEPESKDKTHFDYVFEHYLKDLIEELRLSPVWEESEVLIDSDTDGFVSTIRQSLENIIDQPSAKRWGPVIGVLILGFAIFFLYNERLGYMVTIALLTVIGLGRSQNS